MHIYGKGLNMDTQYRPAKGRANWAAFFLAAHGIIVIAYLISTSAAASPYLTLRQAIIGCLHFTSYIAAAVAFLRWNYLVSQNLAPLGFRNQQFSPGWAVGWWFIPIMQLFQPYLMMVEIWKGSYPQNYSGDAGAYSRTLILLGFWWATWLISGVVGNITLRVLYPSGSIVDWLTTANLVVLFIESVSLVSLTLAIILIRRITSCQEEKHALRRRPPPAGVRYCPQCGEERASDAARFCIACGRQF